MEIYHKNTPPQQTNIVKLAFNIIINKIIGFINNATYVYINFCIPTKIDY